MIKSTAAALAKELSRINRENVWSKGCTPRKVTKETSDWFKLNSTHYGIRTGLKFLVHSRVDNSLMIIETHKIIKSRSGLIVGMRVI